MQKADTAVASLRGSAGFCQIDLQNQREIYIVWHYKHFWHAKTENDCSKDCVGWGIYVCIWLSEKENRKQKPQL